MLKKAAVAASVLVLTAALLVWFLPARLAMLWMTPPHNLRLQQVHGLLWDGTAEVVGAGGQVLGQAHWQVARSALWGKQLMQLDFTGTQLDFSGQMQKLPAGQVEWRALRGRVDLALLDAYAAVPGGLLRGELSIASDHVLLQGGWPLQMQATARWNDAAIHRPKGDIELGSLDLEAQASHGVMAAQLHDDGRGPLEATGALQFSPLGWRLDATLRSRQTDPALGRWLAGLGLGRPDATGTLHLQRSGGLTMGLSAAPAATPSSRTP